MSQQGKVEKSEIDLTALKQRRKEMRLDQGEMAELLGLSRGYYCDIENGVELVKKGPLKVLLKQVLEKSDNLKQAESAPAPTLEELVRRIAREEVNSALREAVKRIRDQKTADEKSSGAASQLDPIANEVYRQLAEVGFRLEPSTVSATEGQS